jgi:hypothetical protein
VAHATCNCSRNAAVAEPLLTLGMLIVRIHAFSNELISERRLRYVSISCVYFAVLCVYHSSRDCHCVLISNV